MPYKDKSKQQSYLTNHYVTNKEKYDNGLKHRKKERMLWFEDLKKGLRCSQCPESHPGCLDFHHLDSTKKRMAVSLLVAQAYSEKVILIEIAKCIVLCSNCHRKLHYAERKSKGEKGSSTSLVQAFCG